MKKEITVSAKTLELALIKAMEELEAPSVEALEYTVLEKENNLDELTDYTYKTLLHFEHPQITKNLRWTNHRGYYMRMQKSNKL